MESKPCNIRKQNTKRNSNVATAELVLALYNLVDSTTPMFELYHYTKSREGRYAFFRQDFDQVKLQPALELYWSKHS